MRRTALRRNGKRSLKRLAMNARLKKRHAEHGWPQTCELRLAGCLKTWALSWAHSRKSRHLITEEDWMHACLSCAACHEKVEAVTHSEMFMLVSDAIRARETAV